MANQSRQIPQMLMNAPRGPESQIVNMMGGVGGSGGTGPGPGPGPGQPVSKIANSIGSKYFILFLPLYNQVIEQLGLRTPQGAHQHL